MGYQCHRGSCFGVFAVCLWKNDSIKSDWRCDGEENEIKCRVIEGKYRECAQKKLYQEKYTNDQSGNNNKAISIPLSNEFSVNSSTTYSLPMNFILEPAERAEENK